MNVTPPRFRAPIWQPSTRVVQALCAGVVALSMWGLSAPASQALAQTVATPAPGEVQALPAFQQLRLNGALDVDVVQAVSAGAAGHRVVITGPANGVSLVQLKVEDGTLHIDTKRCIGACWNVLKGVRAQVTVPDLSAIDLRGSGSLKVNTLKAPRFSVAVSGSGDVRIEQLETDELLVSVAGSGDVVAKGVAKRQRLAVSGSGDVHASNLQGQEVVVKVAGSGDARVWAEQSLTASVAGSGDVTYRGNPSHKQFATAGSGDIRSAK